MTIEGPSKVKMDCQEVSDGYKVQYTPMAPGNYVISIKYGGPNHIGGSPFKAKVTGDAEGSDHVLVLIYFCFSGHHNMVPKRTVFLPSLSGPRLVNVTNASETSTLTLDPAVRASSSSFTQNAVPRLTDSDASKVLSQGSGLSKAFVGQRSSFTLDCSKAGKTTSGWNMVSVVREIRFGAGGFKAHGFLLCPLVFPGKNMLLVGVHGPQVPCEEVLVKHLGNLKYNVSYLLKERGNYILVVKWGDDHIPGSPFQVSVP